MGFLDVVSGRVRFVSGRVRTVFVSPGVFVSECIQVVFCPDGSLSLDVYGWCLTPNLPGQHLCPDESLSRRVWMGACLQMGVCVWTGVCPWMRPSGVCLRMRLVRYLCLDGSLSLDVFGQCLSPDASRRCLSLDASGWCLSPDGSLSLDVSEQCLCPDNLAPDASGGFCLRTCPGGVCLWVVFIV